ncbi:catalase family peroxidase [Paenibacillus spiritus]|uniref:Catalase-related peroxidase n=1 Tax=Paenibacillus spiritus TaxID=2496557 RepID=A0A5J5GCF4_9BACL|nr:catalase family peroxidase [Paenibacillus spiritus]KAA9005835.1 catalase family peroxidase [Paenibacillus spiritus]
MTDYVPRSRSGEPLHTALAGQAVDAIEGLSGRHPGFRRAHAKGICCAGVFKASGEAGHLTTAAHLQAGEYPVTARFSGSSTDPALADLLSPAKGLAVRFELPEGEVANLVATTVPVFFARTPESFVEIVKAAHHAREKLTGKLELLKELAVHFTEAKESALAIHRLKPPASYGTCRYFAIHAYFLVDAGGNRRPVKFEWLPEAGEHPLNAEEAAAKSPDYLEEEIAARLKNGPVNFQLSLVLGQEGDPTDDPTRVWPEDRPRIPAGTLTLTEAVPEPEGLVMDPTAVPAGIALSDDPILNFRRAAYANSLERRTREEAGSEDGPLA